MFTLKRVQVELYDFPVYSAAVSDRTVIHLKFCTPLQFTIGQY